MQEPLTTQAWQDPEWARYWDRTHLDGNPARAAHLALLLEVLEQARPRYVLDLGCGSGIVAEMVLDRLGDARIWGLDASDAMLDLARQRLSRFGDRVRLTASDLTRLDAIEVVDGCTAAIAVQSLHHIGLAQEAVFGWLRDRLEPGGWFLLVDRVAVPGASLYDAFRLAKERYGQGRNPAGWDEYRANLDQNGDHPIPVPELLRMLDEAGFEGGCLDVRTDRAFLVARRR